MTIKRIVAAIFISLFIFTNEVCFARISMSDLSIGGVYLNQNFSEVISIYGRPVNERIPAGYGKIYSFAKNGTVFDVHVTRSNIVKGVKVAGNNGLALDSSGIKFGSSLNSLMKYYGNPDNSSTYKAKNGRIVHVLSYHIRNKGTTQELAFWIDNASGQVVMIDFDEFYG